MRTAMRTNILAAGAAIVLIAGGASHIGGIASGSPMRRPARSDDRVRNRNAESAELFGSVLRSL